MAAAVGCAAQCSFLAGRSSLWARTAVPPPASRGLSIRAARAGLSGGLLGSGGWRRGRRRASPPPSPTTRTRAQKSPEDVPAFKGFPPMQGKPAWYWRLLALVPYIMPLCESWMYAETAYNLHCFIEQYEFWTYPVLRLLGRLPSWFLLAYFFVAYLGIVRRNVWPHFFRFHVVTGMLLEIILQVMGTLNDWIPHGIYWGKIGAHFWLAVFWTYFLTTLETIRCAIMGMYADIPFISDAAYMQIPYD
ncbi:protein TIC 20-I, chloroplastic [Selaginella moellendorffii]|uniref:protein TIC 20-I, chloroplastic n=1 Tax=Selaginella moellendorffii TaxID=88036 RepID=UPI000D1CCC03|nr:protein TIC 20-I, chloroplastic [Selaginella moellendorffii]|eukprot:XP_002984506.2 protein TIC 20-I, chloroplastic [Selaginella moellendorffii]